MDTVKTLAIKYSVTSGKVEAETRVKKKSYCAKVEAKIKIMELIKKAAAKILKKALPALVLLSSSTGFARIKDPNELGKKFQEVAVESVGQGSVVKTHILQNDKDQPQIIVYTLVSKGGGSHGIGDAKVTLKYTEGKGATLLVSDGDTETDSAMLGKEFKNILTTLDTQAKQLASK